MNTKNEEFNIIKEGAENFYRGLDSIFCPFFGKHIKFNNKGLNHIKMKSWNRARLISDQYLRLKFIKLVPVILSRSGTLQEFKELTEVKRYKNNGVWQDSKRAVKYYGFVAIINGVRIKVIIKMMNPDNIFFWSVIPFWKHENDPIVGKIKKVFHEGDLSKQ